MTTTLVFFAPDPDHEFAHLADQRVEPLDHDEVSKTTKVEFRNGFRLVVRDVDLVTREA
jgi:hypothetical protein